MRDYLLAPDPRYAEFLDRDAVTDLVHRHQTQSGRPQPHLLLAILMLEVWLQSYLPRAAGAFVPPRETIRLGG